jgi:hypothetical protein
MFDWAQKQRGAAHVTVNGRTIEPNEHNLNLDDVRDAFAQMAKEVVAGICERGGNEVNFKRPLKVHCNGHDWIVTIMTVAEPKERAVRAREGACVH